ncbi:PAAR domain-containing protein [Pseudomonas jinjuensis]|uniref:Zn-binding Pro-Ala-Ala-Arg (PAAR) domain-containing protein, incolved in TypeVI secretion n=1 Tax=Pseudomonas jinjuensis TaxID=198616 RepID=A0A1H0BUS7_9PSED|nr:PAAR domain-containing protein [Pseudomonas jinjuensis]SDN49337.1 Zn-binding Pro-Ala-Ala-Arg (PAAR) domain-containing protein, incolved in TypeVI secretion [Pseudomonas jinjuensis]
MSGKPAARVTDPTACPVPGHGINPIAAGSPDVLFDGLPAARQGDPSACGGAMAGNVIPNVLINGMPAATVGTVGSHGNVVVSGSGTVVIGTSHSPAAFSGIAPLTIAAAAAVVDAIVPSAAASSRKEEALDYSIKLKRGGNHVLTPLAILDFDELESGTTKNQEAIDFVIVNRAQVANSLTLEVLDGARVLYTEPSTAALLPEGEHPWRWDGYDTAGVLDTRVLKSPALKVRLTANKGDEEQVFELTLSNNAAEADWVDSRIDRNTSKVEVTVRPSFSDGGIKGKNPSLTAKTFEQRKAMAKEGIERYWSREGRRGNGIDQPVNTSRGTFKVTVVADANAKPSAKDFPLIELLDVDFGRSTSFAMFKKIYRNSGYRTALGWPSSAIDEDFAHTAAHEFGHLVLNEYGDRGLIPNYSWSHKSTSTVLTQSPVGNHPLPAGGEIDLMHYHSDDPRTMADYWARSIASEQDVKGLIWLSRVQFDD